MEVLLRLRVRTDVEVARALHRIDLEWTHEVAIVQGQLAIDDVVRILFLYAIPASLFQV